MNIVALHGDYATPEMMQRDMGDPTWINHYFDARGWRYYEKSIEKLVATIMGPTILVGYSRGCAAIAELTTIPMVAAWIRAAVIYEGPVTVPQCYGSFPVLQIWNNRGALKRPMRIDDCIQSMAAWSSGHPTTLMIGNGKHMQLNPPGHDWDRSLNSRIENWIKVQIAKDYLRDALASPRLVP